MFQTDSSLLPCLHKCVAVRAIIQLFQKPILNLNTGRVEQTKLMKQTTAFVLISIVLLSCGATMNETTKPSPKPVAGTWRLLKGVVVEKGDTTITDYTKEVSFIKIINDTHFAFLQHGLKSSKDSAVFIAGGGRYSLKDSMYTEHLEYCSAREWEGHDFTFTITLKGDTLVQHGIEKVEGAGVNRINTEPYVRVKG